MTVPEFEALATQWRERNRRWETMLAQIAFLFYSAHRNERAQQLGLEDFMLTKAEPHAPAATREQPKEQQARRRSLAPELEAYFLNARR